MKIKVDFVTNSSSVSFIAIGAYINLSDFYKNAPAAENDLYDYIDEKIKESDLKFTFGEYDYCNNFMIGIPYTSMQDDETLGEFKTKVKKQLKKYLNVNQDVKHIEACWRDG